MVQIHSPLVNFSRDLRRISRLAAMALWAGSALAVLAAGWLVSDGLALRDDATASARIEESLAEQRAQAKSRAASAPAPEAYRILRSRIERLNVLDFAGSASTGKLLDALEELLPPRVALTALDYDRSKRTVDMVAVSEASEALTSLFDVLDRNALFAEVRLLDKKQAPGALGSQVQVHLNLRLRENNGGKADEETARASRGAS
jgi:Tfp pilus assembly protein PilN